MNFDSGAVQPMEATMAKKIPIFWIVVALIWAGTVAIEYFFLSRHESVLLGSNWNWGLSAFLLQLIYILFSFQTIGPTELGARLFFGKPVDEVSSGLVFIPLGICQLQTETRLTIQDELPADPEKIFRNEDKEKVPDGMFPPIRIPFGNPAKPSNDPLDVRVTAEVVPVVRWRIVDYVKFLTTIGSKEQARRQMQDTAVAMLTDAFAKVTPAKALTDLSSQDKGLKDAIQGCVNLWGIELRNAQVKAINFHRSLNEAVASIPKETAEARAKVITAEGEKKKLTLEGEGRGAAEKAELDGRTRGFKKMAKELAVPASAIIGAETARAITANPGQKTVVVGSSGFKELIGVAAAVGETLKSTPDTEPKAEGESS